MRLSTTCIGASEHGRAFLAGAEPITADIVVGADGLNSVVRRSLFGEEPLRYDGRRAWHAGTRFDEGRIGNRFVEVWGVGGGFGFGPAGQGRVYWYCFESVPEGAPAPERPREEFLGRYGAWFDPIPALIEATEPEAIEDAVVLGVCAATRRDPEQVLREYERRRIPRANAAVRASRRTGRRAEATSRAAARLRDVAMKTLPDRLTVAQLRGMFEFDPHASG